MANTYAPLPVGGSVDAGGRSTSPTPGVSKNAVVDWLLQSGEDDVLWVLARVNSHRPSLMSRASQTDVADSGLTRQPTSDTRGGRNSLMRKTMTVGAEGSDHYPIVQFCSAFMYCVEELGTARLDLIRLGDRKPRIEVWLKTRDRSAKAGSKYQPLEAKVIFEEGEWNAQAEVQLIDDENWDPNLELSVELQSDGLVNATLGRYLWQTRIKIIDDDTFPTNKFKAQLLAQRHEEVATLDLFLEYLRMNYRNKVIKWRTHMVLSIGCLDNSIFLMELFAGVYLVDYVFNVHHSDLTPLFGLDKPSSLVLTSSCYVFPFAVVHYCHYWRAGLGHVGGGCRKTLQAALLRQYLNFDHIARANLRSSDLVMSTTRSATLLVSHGYKAAIRLFERIGHLTAVLAFQVLSPLFFDRGTSLLFFLPLFIFPVFAISFLLWRQKITSVVLHSRFKQQDLFADYIEQTVENYQLIADYTKRSHAIDRFEVRINEFNNANRQANVVLLNNSYFIIWIGKVLVFAWSLIGGMQVLNGHLTLGMFLVNIRICNGICKSWKSIYAELLDIETIFPILEHLVQFINTPTDVDVRASLSAHNWAVTSTLIESNGRRFTQLKLQMSNVHFSYQSQSQGGADRITNLRGHGLLEVRPGELICLVGPRGGGKTTVLKLLAGQILPSQAAANELAQQKAGSTEYDDEHEPDQALVRFYVPAHFRALAVTTDAMFIQGSLLENLAYGVHPGDPDANKDRIARICARLGVGDDVLRELESEEVHKWGSVISHTQKHLLCLARALIANPDVLCLHKPTMLLDEHQTHNVLGLLVDFVQNAGIEQDHVADRSLSGPRTCIFTTTKNAVPDSVDRIYHISVDQGIQHEPKGKSMSSLNLATSY